MCQFEVIGYPEVENRPNIYFNVYLCRPGTFWVHYATKKKKKKNYEVC